jgi:hypothetical protein
MAGGCTHFGRTWHERTAEIWRDGTCPRSVESKSVRTVIGQCADELLDRVTRRLDGRGELTLASAGGAVGAIASSAAPVATTNGWILLGAAPIYYENLHGARMAAIEFAAGFGLTWITDQMDAYNLAFDNLCEARNEIEDTTISLNSLRDRLRDLSSETGGSPEDVQVRNAAKIELARFIGDAERAESEALLVLREADARLDLRRGVDAWARQRYHQVYFIALQEQNVSRVGPSEAFRELLALPFTTISDTVRGRSSKRLDEFVKFSKLDDRLSELQQPMGATPIANGLSNVVLNTTELDADSRTLAIRALTEVRLLTMRIERVRAAASALATIDGASLPKLANVKAVTAQSP